VKFRPYLKIMETIKINGVGYNIDAVQSMTKEQFFALPVHDISMGKILKEKRAEAMEEVWAILSSKFKNNGKSIGNGTQNKAVEPEVLSTSGGDGAANKRTVPKSKRNAISDGDAEQRGSDNA
jgi:hypothetical protein